MPLRLCTQTKLVAALTSPLPTYFGQPGYSHSGRVRPGTPTLSGSYDFTVQAEDANGFVAERDYTLVIGGAGDTTAPVITPESGESM